ncbi:hypothetical protein D922_03618 [Enterococcus faecalis 06-MB-DW-09]|nr:hypothetical protein D922_03618 [Enterococcus faecalis 06-MB-DW-09]
MRLLKKLLHCSQNDRRSTRIPFPSASQPALAFLIGYIPFIQRSPEPIQIKNDCARYL